MPPDKQPTAVVMIDMDPHEVDVNVHPTKAEVRFRNPQQVHGLVLTAMRRELLASDLTPNVAPAPGSFPAPGSGFRFPISEMHDVTSSHQPRPARWRWGSVALNVSSFQLLLVPSSS